MRQTRRVLLIQQTTVVGGAEMHCRLLAEEYVRRGITVGTIIPEDGDFDAVAASFAEGGASVYRLNTDTRLGRVAQFRRLAQLVGIIRGFRPDVVHIHTGGATGGLLPALATRLASRATLAHTEHDVPPPAPGRGYRLSKRLSGSLLHVPVAVSRRNARLRLQRIGGPRDRFVSVLNGVDLAARTAADRRRNRARVRSQFEIAPESVVIGSAVRLAAGKGLDTLLEAFAEVARGRPVRLLLVGDGPLRPRLEASAEDLGIAGKVVFAGYHPDAQPFLDAMDIFVLAVPAGSMSIALLEAMAAGVPPVITFCGPEEAVLDGRTGLCAPPDDAPGLAAALTRLALDAGLRQSIGASAQAHVGRHFSSARVADDMLEAYASGRGGRVPERLRAEGPDNALPGGAGECDCPQPDAAVPATAAAPAAATATPPRSRTPR